MEPIISVIVPVYNVEKYIDRCLESLLNQSYENLEIIFVDDCSEDGTWEEILKLSSEYPNVFGYRTEQNSGFAGEPRNIGLRNSTAPYIMFLDSDDLYLNDACETLYNIIVEKNVDIVSGNYIITNGEDCYPNEEWNAKWLNIKWNNNLVEIKNINEIIFNQLCIINKSIDNTWETDRVSACISSFNYEENYRSKVCVYLRVVIIVS